jgi:multidrug resistance efflux pump
MSKSQIFRIAIGIGLVIIIIYVYVPRFIFTYSVNAVVSARQFTLTAPIPGVVKEGPPLFGSELHPGETIVVLENPTIDTVKLEELIIEENSNTERVAALQQEMANLKKLKEEISHSKNMYFDSLKERTSLELRKAEQRQRELLATLFETRKQLRRKEHLVKGGYVSQSVYDTSKYDYDRASQAVDQAESEIKNLIAKLDSLNAGVYVNTDGRTDVPYQLQRYDEISIREADLESKIREFTIKSESIRASRIVEEKRIAELKKRVVTSPVHGAIWRVFVSEGSFVDINMPIVEMIDCTNVFVNVSLPERLFETIKPGQKARIRLSGSSENIYGEVAYIRGGAVDPKTAGFMVGLTHINRQREMEVLVKIHEDALGSTKGDFCNVGRMGEVTFLDKG